MNPVIIPATTGTVVRPVTLQILSLPASDLRVSRSPSHSLTLQPFSLSLSCLRVLLLLFSPEKRAQRLTFWLRRPPGEVGVFHAKGWWPKSSCPPSKVCLPWVSTREIWDVPGVLPGCPGPLDVSKKLVLQKFVCIFRSL